MSRPVIGLIGVIDTTGKRTAAYTDGPYGEQRTNTGTQQPFRCTNAYLDPSGLYKMGARYYALGLGRFTQPDLSGKEWNGHVRRASDPGTPARTGRSPAKNR
ncbi:RHS repeat-associated core domain-containing protein [Streptomyces seoulensis]